jgi:REP element-mobilizing transposase RayT
MTTYLEKLESGHFYHVYNRGINGCNLFESEDDYQYFLTLYEKYISPIADTYAWVLMPNHFHFLVRIKEDVIYKFTNANRSIDAVGFETNKWETLTLADSVADVSVLKGNDDLSALKGSVDVSDLQTKKPNPTKHISHFFNAYAKHFNTINSRHGALFERPFKRKRIDSEDYFRQAVLYIHNNPVHHGFVSHPIEYGWSSFLPYLSEKETHLKRDEVLKWFGDKANFEAVHHVYKADSVADLSAFDDEEKKNY